MKGDRQCLIFSLQTLKGIKALWLTIWTQSQVVEPAHLKKLAISHTPVKPSLNKFKRAIIELIEHISF